MPAASADSTSPVPFGTCTALPSTLTRTSSAALTVPLPCNKLLQRPSRPHAGTREASNKLLQARSRRHLGNGRVPVLVDRREDALERRLTAERAAALVDVTLELVAEAIDVARDGHRRRVAQRAQAMAEDSVADVEQQIELALLGPPVLDLAQQLHHPTRALAAGRALAARLVHVELGDTQAELHHAASIVDDDHGARAEHRADGRHRVEVERRVDL